MIKVKEMPYSEKYANVQDSIRHESLVPAFIEKHLGKSAVADFQKVCREGVKPIPEDASPEAKYEIAYSNWMWMGRCAFGFVRERMGEEGIKQFVSINVEAIKHRNAGPALFMLKIIRAISPGLAFTMVSKQTVYKLQWLSPYSVSELNRNRTVLSVPRCKLLDFPDSDDVCFIG
jgi:hypothetical protein